MLCRRLPLQVLIQRQQAALQQQPLSLQQQEEMDEQQPFGQSSSKQQAQQLQLQLQQQPVLALDTDGSGAGAVSNRIHVASRQQHVQGRAAGSSRLACLSLALPIVEWR